MRSFALFAAAALVFATTVAENSQAQNAYPVATTSYVCAKCGKVHSRPAPSATMQPGPVVAQTQYVQNAYPSSTQVSAPSGGGTQSVLATLNAQRSRQGLPSLRYDGQLQAVAQQRAQMMASTGTKTHPPGSFAPGRYEGVGWSSSFTPGGVYACYTSDPNMTVAGAAMAYGRDGVYFAVVYR
ncbi:CAP domain-containing protein [Stieleria varia]|uniref:Cysteine-rich secretory protein family protein n=1 Tax=Stieleria varia TaxID=2528005 RepID=A0A5C6A897_9BACT|nr:CAP domain-containing protein [Stieleria varia]TWT94523.1 Cysteine-rich secretory protein family protein [Stieleria varia]